MCVCNVDSVSRPSYTHQTESYVSEAGGGWHDRNDFGSKFGSRPEYNERPHFSQYQYPSGGGGGGGGGGQANHPANHPASGDGQWVLLSTNRGYSKSRQRSIKFEGPEPGNKRHAAPGSDENEHVPAVTSKRQVSMRLSGCSPRTCARLS